MRAILSRRSRLATALLWLIVLTVGVCRVRADEVIDRVLAVVAGDVIMLSDVRAARDLGLLEPGDAADPDRAVLSQLIDRALILDEVDRYAPPEPAAEAVDRALNAVRSRFASPQAFATVLARVGCDERQLRAMLRENLRIRSYLDQRFAGENPERGNEIIAAWVAGLRSRATIIDLYAPTLNSR